jgi:hypothetical protein
MAWNETCVMDLKVSLIVALFLPVSASCVRLRLRALSHLTYG